MSFLILAAAVLATPAPAPARCAAPTFQKPRVIVLSDIGNEPDDSQSMVRLLTYANDLDIEGLVATTSVWQRSTVQPALIAERVKAYGIALPNLKRHAAGYPDSAQLAGLIRSGVAAYGMAGVGDGKDTEASRLIVAAVDKADARPLQISVWGGAADLAQAIWSVRATRTGPELAAFLAKLRVYSISDQDDAGPWLRRTFPHLFWIASLHGWNQYQMASWYGISGDLNREPKWPYADMVSDAWRAEHIERGPLGAVYPKRTYIMEGDTPALLYIIPNGLGDTEHPEFGSWGGRYVEAQPGAGSRADAVDSVTFPDGRSYRSNQAGVFRWRDAFQRDFAARIGWTLTPDYTRANHAPVLRVNGQGGLAPVRVVARPGETVALDAAGSCDPDGDTLSYRWWQYPEPSGSPWMAASPVADATRAKAAFTVPKGSVPITYHLILEATDSGTMPITRYRRVLVEVKP